MLSVTQYCGVVVNTVKRFPKWQCNVMGILHRQLAVLDDGIV
jgi:hypothetical protein